MFISIQPKEILNKWVQFQEIFSKKELLFQVPEGGKYPKNPFKGDIDCAKLKELITKLGVENVHLIFTIITNNTVCGQAVSMKSTKVYRINEINKGNSENLRKI